MIDRSIRLRWTLAAAALASPAVARERTPAPTPASITALEACRVEADPAKRLACYDKAAGELQTAIAANTVYVVDKTEVRQTRRSLFGLPLPKLGLFGDAAKDINTVDEVTTVATSASEGGDGNWQVTLEDGSVWRQTDARMLGRTPARGSTIVIRRAALGSYKMNIDKGPAIRVRRVG